MVNFLHNVFLPGRYSQIAQDDDSVSSHEKDISGESVSHRKSILLGIYYRSRWLRLAGWTIAILFATAIIAIFSFYLRTTYTQTRGTIEFVPDMGRRTVVFEAIPIFNEPPSTQSDQAWDSLLPPGRGFILVDNPEAYDLNPGISTDSGIDRYSVSMFHQLHCLGMIRKEFFGLMSNTSHQPHHASQTDNSSALSSAQKHLYHTNHCFDYIRQAIMCAGDMTLEWAIQELDGGGRDVDGWGIPHHHCKNWSMIWDYMIEHQAANNNTHIA